MFGIGATELLVILVLATILLGPEKMIEFAGQLGRWLSKIRAETDQITREFRDAFNLELEKDNPTARSSGSGGMAFNLPTASTPAQAPAVAAAEGGEKPEPVPVEAASTAAAKAPSQEVVLETKPAEEPVVNLDPDAAPIEIEVGLLISDSADAEPLTLEGPVLIEDEVTVVAESPEIPVEEDVETISENAGEEA